MILINKNFEETKEAEDNLYENPWDKLSQARSHPFNQDLKKLGI